MKKHLSLICLLLSLLCILPLNAYAAESKDTTLKYAVGSSYTLTIPDYIEANTDGQSVSVSDAILPWGYALDVTADFDSALKLNDFSDITLSYDLYVNDSKISPNDEVLTQDAGDNGSGSVIVSANVTGVPTYAGTYTATITFNAELKEVLQTDYTVEEIENDPHLFGIGMTKPEYVVAHFNDDYSSAVITKNGDDSDGRMREFDARKSPFSLNKETLSTVIVKAGVTSIGINAFYECSNLSKVQLPDGLQVIYRDAFYSCTSLENFYLSDDITKIEEYAFYSCESLTNVKLPSNLKRIEAGTFSGCTNLNTVEMGNQITVIDAHAFSSCAFKNITLPSSLQSIGVWAFRYCNFLESIDIPETVTSIGSTCFADCKNLQNINLPSGLTEIASSTFNNCSSLETIDIPTGVTSIGSWGFSNCHAIKNMNLPESLQSVDVWAFSAMSSVESFNISEKNAYFCTADGVLFSKDMSKLYYFPLGKNTTEYVIPESVTTLGTSSFGKCKYLKDIYVHENVTHIEQTMFGNVNHPMVHTPSGSAMEQYCIENGYKYDNIMK